ncbi:hypothetical protein CLU96_3423 [Chryseobacterium sp. 52]|uniref:hypothetical protein n=1 Tax=Chryseobacterium sp. 52 TaxID=2035213 RepID=UPI000C1781B5|nr:hypothetical protein [Chryseobacterium sp. 52]PIF46392.1 hypothetical protein CLU96_3423 [Chryseobacterium sp. 52]
MDTHKDKMIQNIFDDQKDVEEMSEKDLTIYEMVYKSAEKKPDTGFSLGFSTKIIRKIETRQQRQFNLKLYALCSVLLILCLGFMFVFFSEDQFSMMFSMVLHYKYMVIFFLFAVISIQVASRFLTIKKLER